MAETNPKAPIRRFDVFAEYTRQKALQDGMPEDEAAGYGLWVAKVVASRRYGGGPPPPPRKKEGEKDAELQAVLNPQQFAAYQASKDEMKQKVLQALEKRAGGE